MNISFYEKRELRRRMVAKFSIESTNLQLTSYNMSMEGETLLRARTPYGKHFNTLQSNQMKILNYFDQIENEIKLEKC